MYEQSSQQDKDQLLRAKDEQILTQTQDIVVKSQQLEANVEEINAKETVNQELTERLQQLSRDNLVLRNEAEAKERQLRRLNQQVESNEEITAALQHLLTQKEREVSESNKDDQIRDISKLLDDLRGCLSPVSAKRVNLVWESLPKPPVDNDLHLQSSAVHGNEAYFSDCFNNVVVEYNCETKLWCEMPALPINRFTIVCVDHILTSVGGWDDGWFGGSPTNRVYSLIDRKWVNHFPVMRSKRTSPIAVYANNILVVAGGFGNDYKPVSMIEVLNTQTEQWSTATSLPIKMYQASVGAFCGEHIYIAGILLEQDTTPMFKCSRLALIASTQKLQTNVWEEVACVPVNSSSLATVSGHLLSIGGKDSQRKPTADIHQYNPTTDSWEVVSQMSVASRYFHVAVLAGNKIMTVRRVELNNEAEIATFE